MITPEGLKRRLLDPFLKEDPTKREALIWVAETAACTVSAAILAESSIQTINVLTKNFNVLSSREKQNNIISPGWIERNVNADFINADNGHFQFLHDAIFNNPDLLDITKDYFSYLRENWKLRKSVEMDDAFEKAITISHEKLKDKKFNGQTNIKTEAVHAATFAFAAGFMERWWSFDDLETFGFPVDRTQKIEDFIPKLFWGDKGIGTIVYPGTFVKGGDKGSSGFNDKSIPNQDKSVHFAQYLFIGFEYLYSKQFNLRVDEKIPFPLKTYTAGKNQEDQVRVITDIIGRLYETKGLFNLNNLPIGRDRSLIREGYLDYEAPSDLRANLEGVEKGIEIFKIVVGSRGIEPRTSSLSEKRSNR